MTPNHAAFRSSGVVLTREMMMEYDENSKLERRQYVRKAVLTIFAGAALAALGAWLVQPETASAKLHLPSPDSKASTVSL
ncbi:hypothetical protein [Rhizobium miluonense]|uniref:Uncharacterized protein n=1 Tax=Rhizobium miluonense TaxID=411945 RepID=A0A1C3U8N2_9HYPH|nr:hypothetical protein [Rhizobium miluonense]SCB11836.1 hypothetical protein GA0061102_1002158 [Rhizobium miluonense]